MNPRRTQAACRGPLCAAGLAETTVIVVIAVVWILDYDNDNDNDRRRSQAFCVRALGARRDAGAFVDLH